VSKPTTYTRKQIEAVESIDLNLGTNDGIQNKLKKKLGRFEISYSCGLVLLLRTKNSNTNVTSSR
jgi:hypothetical protein